ncbi:hypothetical protein DF3PB_110001 [uncultured Defluviicoccus sp.]|uniref:Uncharacterized protein n=1 Tax=metagenome TaxID=256318 RepID=A0A380T802_9ZZZZ|nr:hypothetical protein DF3PB_110001 [uncultured Defluviicoccus sp.]
MPFTLRTIIFPFVRCSTVIHMTSVVAALLGRFLPKLGPRHAALFFVLDGKAGRCRARVRSG